MTRTALTALFILAAFVVAMPASRSAHTDIPSANVQGWTQGDRETDPSARTGGPDAEGDSHSEPGLSLAAEIPLSLSGSPSPSSGTFRAPRPSSSLPGVAAGSGKPRIQVSRKMASQSPALSKKRASSLNTGRSLTGVMSWFCLPGRSACTAGVPTDCACAAAGPRLRAALGDWRGRTVTVSAGNASARVRLIDWCACVGGYLLDGYAALWGGLGLPLSAGLADVEVSW